jgi:2-methylaconitate cis-trans-isomerase PrpF
MQKKYVVLDHCMPITFYDVVPHDKMKSCGNITSAGFYMVENGKVHCYGESTSLNMKPCDTDETILARFLDLGTGP